jgi:hypothetical protein
VYSVIIEGVASRLLAQYCQFLVEQGDLENAPTPQQAVESALLGFFDNHPEFAAYRAALRKQQNPATHSTAVAVSTTTHTRVVHMASKKGALVRDAA